MAITDPLVRDHRLLRRKLALVEHMVASAPQPSAVQCCCRSLMRSLTRHLDREERVLDAYARRVPASTHDGFSRLHATCRESLRDMDALYCARVRLPTSAMLPRLYTLIERLRAHMIDEERNVFPLIDKAAACLEPADGADGRNGAPSGALREPDEQESRT